MVDPSETTARSYRLKGNVPQRKTHHHNQSTLVVAELHLFLLFSLVPDTQDDNRIRAVVVSVPQNVAV